MTLNLTKKNNTLLGLLFFIIVLVNVISSVNAMEWHNCCDVTINENKLTEIYYNYIETEHCYDDKSFDDCLFDYEQLVLKGEQMGIDSFRKVLIEDSIKECNAKIKLHKERFYGSCEGVLFCDDIKKEYSGTWFEEEYFEDPSYKQFEVKYFGYNLDGTLNKYRRSGSQYEQLFVLSNSRFNYLQPRTDIEKYQKNYDSAYALAKEICINDNISSNDNEFIPCIDKNIKLSQQENEIYHFYTNAIIGGGDNYISGLTICEETLGFQNDIGLVTFPGQSGFEVCEESDMLNGCCPGYHMDAKFNVCCASGFEAYEKEDGTILCGLVQQDDRVVSVDIKLSKSELILDNKDFITAILTYSAKTPAGDIVPYAKKNIFHGIVAKSQTSQYSFDVEKLSDKTDSEGKLTVKINLKNAKINTLGTSIEDVRVMVYSLDQPDFEQDDTYFTLSFGDGLHIDYIEIISNQQVWQNSPVKLKVKVIDPIYEKKLFKLESSTSFNINGKDDDFIAYYTTNDDEFEFTWFAPQISLETKMNYVKRIVGGLVKMGLVVAEDLGGNKLGTFLGKAENAEKLSQNFKNVNDVYNKMNLLVKVDLQATGAKSLGTNLVKTASDPYKYAQKGINTVLWMEGTMGILGNPAAPLLTTLKTGLTGVNEWYQLVEDMEKVAKAEKIVLDVPITVSVEGLQTETRDSMTKSIPVEGFKMVGGN